MKKVGVIGLGDMGIGMAENLLKNGFQVTGYDLSSARLESFEKMGGKPAENATGVARASDTVFVMVLNGKQVEDAVFGAEGLIHELSEGDTVVVTATITPKYIVGVFRFKYHGVYFGGSGRPCPRRSGSGTNIDFVFGGIEYDFVCCCTRCSGFIRYFSNAEFSRSRKIHRTRRCKACEA